MFGRGWIAWVQSLESKFRLEPGDVGRGWWFGPGREPRQGGGAEVSDGQPKSSKPGPGLDVPARRPTPHGRCGVPRVWDGRIRRLTSVGPVCGVSHAATRRPRWTARRLTPAATYLRSGPSGPWQGIRRLTPAATNLRASRFPKAGRRHARGLIRRLTSAATSLLGGRCREAADRVDPKGAIRRLTSAATD